MVCVVIAWAPAAKLSLHLKTMWGNMVRKLPASLDIHPFAAMMLRQPGWRHKAMPFLKEGVLRWWQEPRTNVNSRGIGDEDGDEKWSRTTKMLISDNKWSNQSCIRWWISRYKSIKSIKIVPWQNSLQQHAQRKDKEILVFVDWEETES